MKMLKNQVAVVTGASRGVGRGIALVLGQAGATVYVTGRSTQTGHRTDGRSETIQETADMVTASGGVGIAVQCDHTKYDQVQALFKRMDEEQGHIDILVNSVFGGSEDSLPVASGRLFWQRPREDWVGMMDAGVRAAFDASCCAVPLMLPRRSGLIVQVTSWDSGKHHGNLYYDLAMNALCRMSSGMAQDLLEQGIAVVALSPGFVRTERVSSSRIPPEMLEETESTQYVGRAVVALASDPSILSRSGSTLSVGDLAREYNFTDIDGRQPLPYKL